MGCIKSIFKNNIIIPENNESSIPFIHYEIYNNYLKNFYIEKRFEFNKYVYKIIENNRPYILKIHYDKKSFINEYTILNQIKPLNNTINLYKHIDFSKRDVIEGGIILYDYIPGTDLFTYIKNNELTPISKKQIFKKIAYIVNDLHNNNILHGDIKLENIICKYNRCQNLFLIDYGLSIKCRKHRIYKTNKCFGSIPYIPPELFNSRFSQKSDIWSLGCLLYILICEKAPFSSNKIEYNTVINNIDYYLEKLKKIAKEELSDELFDLIFNMIEIDITKRYTINQVINHKWLNN